MNPVLVIHGGAGKERPASIRADIADHLQQIAAACWPALQDGASALDTVVNAAQMLESDPLFNAGRGSKLQIDGAARLSASLMDGTLERFSGVINVEHLAHPILLCRHLIDEKDRVLAGAGAMARARELGLEEADVRTAQAIALWKAQVEGETGTIGAVALDTDGRLAASTSTGGRGLERIGRVSDSATVAGNYATGTAAASCTGIGEDIVDGALAVRLVAAAEAGQPLPEAARTLRARMDEMGWRAGLIALDHTGAWAVPYTTTRLYWHTVEAGTHHSFHKGN